MTYQQEEAGKHSAHSAIDPRRLYRCDDDVQRCDAKRPCTPCSKDEESDCVYERRRVKRRVREEPLAAAQTSPFSLESRSSLSRSPSRVDSEGSSPSSTSNSVFSLPGRTLSDSSKSECRSSESDTPYEPETPIPQEKATPEMTLVPFQGSTKPRQLATMSTFSIPSSLRFFSIPRPLRVSLSSLSPEHFQVSDTTSSELDMALCAFHFLGCYTQTSQELTLFVQPPRCATAIEAVRDLSPGSQAGCCIAWRCLEHHRQSILRPRLGWARNAFLRRCRTLTHVGQNARETRPANS